MDRDKKTCKHEYPRCHCMTSSGCLLSVTEHTEIRNDLYLFNFFCRQEILTFWETHLLESELDEKNRQHF